MKINVQDHKLVPKHIIMKENEIKDLTTKYNVSLKQLPKISRNDPVIVNLGAKPKDVIKIIRKSTTAGESVYYRAVV